MPFLPAIFTKEEVFRNESYLTALTATLQPNFEGLVGMTGTYIVYPAYKTKVAPTTIDFYLRLTYADYGAGPRTIFDARCYPFLEVPQPYTFDPDTVNSVIEYVIQTITTPTGGHYTGLRVATVVVKGGGNGALIDTEVDVVDHSGGLFDIAGNMTGYTGWATWAVYESLQPSIACDSLTPYHWAAINRVCDPDTGLYATPCS